MRVAYIVEVVRGTLEAGIEEARVEEVGVAVTGQTVVETATTTVVTEL